MDITPTLRFRYSGKGRCEARHGVLHALVETLGPDRRPYRATLTLERKAIATKNFSSMTAAQQFLRAETILALTSKTTFELADWAVESNLETRFDRRAAVHAKRHGLVIIGMVQKQLQLENRPTIVRTYSCLRKRAAQPAEVA